MTQIYGVDAGLFQRLPAEDQAAIRQSWQQGQGEAAPMQADVARHEPPPPTPPVDPGQAATAREAVEAIHSMPLPDNSDLARPPMTGFPESDRQSIIEGRNTSFNQARGEAAQEALDRLRPERADYDALPPATADMEYRDALATFNSDPYVKELERIVTEAEASPGEIPGYLQPDATRVDVDALPLPQARGALAMLGIDLPENATPQQIADGYQILATVPQDILGPLVNPGYSVGFSGDMAGIGTPGWLPVRGEANATVVGEVELSDVQTGVGFEQTQRFEASVEVRGEAGVDLGKTPLQRIYGWADKLGKLPDSARELVEGSPLLSKVMKGLPVSGSYHEFAGVRLDYEAIVTPQQGTRLADGDLGGLPNPLDPLAMPEGSSVLIRGQSLEGSAFEANYKMFTVGTEHIELSGLGLGVTRLDGSMVEVTAGQVDTVENEMFLGLGRQGTAAIGIGTQYSGEGREMQVARIDLSTAEGQAAYQQFLATGQVPDWAPPGVPQSGTTSIFDAEHARFAGIELGPVKLAVDEQSQFTVRDTNWADGSIDRQVTYANSGGLTTDIRFPVGADGKPDYDQAQWTVVRADMHPVSAAHADAAYRASSTTRELDGNQHVQMSFSSDELMAIRDMARDYVVKEQGQEKLDNLDAGIESPWWANSEQALAVATTPEEVFAVLSDDRHGGSVMEDIHLLAFHSGEPFPGDFRMQEAG